MAPVLPAAADNGYGPGAGPQAPTQHWGGAYVLTGVPGYAYCIFPGSASPTELPTTPWSPVAYPGSGVFTDGQMAALAYFAERYQGTGWNGYPVDTTVAAIAQIAYTSAGGTTPPGSRAPAALVAAISAWITTYAGPWTISLTMTPSSGSAFTTNRNYSGTVTVRSATGAGVGGLQLTPPPTGGPPANQVSNFGWLAATTNAAGQLSFVWNIDAVPPGGVFSAQGINVVGDAPGTAPPAYGAPSGTGGQLMMVSGASEVLGTGFGGVASSPTVLTGTISIVKAVNDPAYYGPGGAVFQIRDGFGNVLDTLVTDGSGDAGPSIPLTATTTGTQYAVVEVTAAPGYQLAPPMVVTIHPHTTTVASFTGPNTELAVPAALGAAKIDTTTGDPVAGAVFDFSYDRANNGVYDQDLGSCTTSGAGTCQPPTQNTAGGWLPGWYQVTETAAPPGYWLDPATAVQTVFLAPGATAVASVTFADPFLGSLSLTKTGNDTAYWGIAGAVFTATGPAPSTAAVGTLTVGATGSTNTLTGLVPGTYHLIETTVPPGYSAVTPFTVTVSAGHATTTTAAADAVQPGTLVVSKTDAATAAALSGATFDIRYDPTGSGTYSVDLGSCTTDASGTCSPSANDGTGFLPGNYEVVETAAPPGYDLPTPVPTDHVTVDPAGTTTAAFTDALLVSASFTKVATGSVNPTQLVLAGAVIDVTAGTDLRRDTGRHLHDRRPRQLHHDDRPDLGPALLLVGGNGPAGTGRRGHRLLRGRQRPGRATDHRHRRRRVRGHRRQEGRRRGPDRGPARRGLRPLPEGRRHRAQRADPIDRRAHRTGTDLGRPSHDRDNRRRHVPPAAPRLRLLRRRDPSAGQLRARLDGALHDSACGHDGDARPGDHADRDRRRSASHRRRPQVQLGHADNRHPRRRLRPLRRRGRPAVRAAVGGPDRRGHRDQ